MMRKVIALCFAVAFLAPLAASAGGPVIPGPPGSGMRASPFPLPWTPPGGGSGGGSGSGWAGGAGALPPVQTINRLEKSCMALGGVWDGTLSKCRIAVDPETLCREYEGNWDGNRCVFPLTGTNLR